MTRKLGNCVLKIESDLLSELRTRKTPYFATRWSFYTIPILTSNMVPLQKLNNKMIFLGNFCSVLQIQSWTNWACPGRPIGRPHAQCDDLTGWRCIQKSCTCNVFGTTPHYLLSHVFWMPFNVSKKIYGLENRVVMSHGHFYCQIK